MKASTRCGKSSEETAASTVAIPGLVSAIVTDTQVVSAVLVWVFIHRFYIGSTHEPPIPDGKD